MNTDKLEETKDYRRMKTTKIRLGIGRRLSIFAVIDSDGNITNLHRNGQGLGWAEDAGEESHSLNLVISFVAVDEGSFEGMSKGKSDNYLTIDFMKKTSDLILNKICIMQNI